MAKTLVTGATGFIGSHVAHELAKRGDDLKLAVRKKSNAENLKDLEFERAAVDILDTRSLRRAMKGIDKVFHVAGSVSMAMPVKQLREINVVGTQNVMNEALRADVSKVIHTSSVAAVGPAKPRGTVDENSEYSISRLGLSYADSKRDGEIEALRVAAKGLPVVIVNPAFVLGWGDVNRGSTFIVRQFLKREIPVYVDGGLNIVDVGDVARGHLLADEKGKVGERYILGNQNYSHERFFNELSLLSGVEPPAVKLPVEVAMALLNAGRFLPFGFGTNEELIRSASQWWTCKTNKAKRELGYQPKHPEQAMRATVDWYLERDGEALGKKTRQPLMLRAAGRALRMNRRFLSELRILAEEDA